MPRHCLPDPSPVVPPHATAARCRRRCHAIRMAPEESQAKTIYLVVMQNAEYIASHRVLGRVLLKVDLKGSWVKRRKAPGGRLVTEALTRGKASAQVPTAKDMDLLEAGGDPQVQQRYVRGLCLRSGA